LQVFPALSEAVRYNRNMAKRYDQYCPVCHALSLVGERWSLLVVRELLRGPKRYTDLVEGLPGVGTNVLAARLRELEQGGIVRKRKLPPPAASTVYELTEYGAELEEPLYALARWGARSLGPPGPKDDLYPDWGLNAFAGLLDPQAARGLKETYVMRVDDDTYTVQLDDGQVHVEEGAAPKPDLDASMGLATFYGLASGELTAGAALADGRVELLKGKSATLGRFFNIFSFAARERVAV
jgi:DNA-binding HxlR family transcriptional regulator/putative sterol carrier protein